VTTQQIQPTSANLYEQVTCSRMMGGTLHPGGSELTRRALELGSLEQGTRVLDLGCGTGLTVQYLCQQGYPAIGMDSSRALIEREFSARLDFCGIQGDALALPIQARSFGAVIGECSLSVFTNPGQVLKEVNRILCPEGVLILADLYAHVPEQLSEIRSLIPHSCLANAFAQEELWQMLQEAGFSLAIWEDHAQALSAFQTGTDLNTLINPENLSLDPFELVLAISRAKISYFLCIAQKKHECQ
jgi:ubiquinone/menaquinone biosynthesis C-methylase UbiE